MDLKVLLYDLFDTKGEELFRCKKDAEPLQGRCKNRYDAKDRIRKSNPNVSRHKRELEKRREGMERRRASLGLSSEVGRGR
jgi:hypothetical protein